MFHIKPRPLNLYSYGQIIWRRSDRFERLVTVAAEVLATPSWKCVSYFSFEQQAG